MSLLELIVAFLLVAWMFGWVGPMAIPAIPSLHGVHFILAVAAVLLIIALIQRRGRL